jgi:hypothetical protein
MSHVDASTRLIPAEAGPILGPIPRRIIQIGEQSLPPLCKAAVQTVIKFNPDFEYMFFDDDGMNQFVVEYCPQYVAIFRSCRFPIQRCDLFRYLVIYHCGGFYLDTDVFLGLPLNELLDSGCVFTFETLTANRFFLETFGMDWEIGNYAFGAAAGHPFVRSIIDNCVKALDDPDWSRPMLKSIPRVFRDDYVVLHTTGPGLVTRTLAEYPGGGAPVTVLFPDDVCDPNNWNLFGPYGVHVRQGKWRQRNGFIRRRLLSAWKSWETRGMREQGAVRGKTRTPPLPRAV